MTPLSALLAAAAVLVWRPPWSWVRVRLVGATARRPSQRAVVALLSAASVTSLLVLPPAPAIVAWTLVGASTLAWRRTRRARARARQAAVRDEVAVLVDALVAELRTGAPPGRAVQRLAAESPLLEPAAVAAESGGDIAAALCAVGERPGAAALLDVGRAWAVSQACGAPLVGVLERVREAARDERELHRELVAGVAPARATVALVAAMPPLGLALGSGLGVDPLGVVLTTVPGAVCLAAGVGFAAAGIVWIDLIADRAEADA